MALPSTWKQPGDTTPSYAGIGINLIPGDVLYGCEVQRTSDDGTGVAASTGATSIAEYAAGVLPESGRVVFDALPMDDAKRFYRARHTGIGYDAGAWTSWTTGHKPVLLGQRRPDILPGPSVYPLKRDRAMTDGAYAVKAANSGGTQFASDLYLPSTMVLNVGTTGTPSTITKYLFIAPQEFTASSSGTTSIFLVNALQPTVYGSTQTYQAPLLFPRGVTITQLDAYINAGSTAADITVRITGSRTTDPDFSLGVLAGASNSTTPGWELVTAALSRVASSSDTYTLEALIHRGSAAVAGKLGNVIVTYTMPDYSKAL